MHEEDHIFGPSSWHSLDLENVAILSGEGKLFKRVPTCCDDITGCAFLEFFPAVIVTMVSLHCVGVGVGGGGGGEVDVEVSGVWFFFFEHENSTSDVP